MIHESPSFDSSAELFAFIRMLPWRTLRIYRCQGKWRAVSSTFSNKITAKA